MKPKVSIVIPTYNEKERIARCIESLLCQSYPQNKIEIIVVDDGSTDGTSPFIKKNFPKVKLITKKNSGAYDSRNKGIAIASGKIIALTDGDCVATKNWIKNIEKILREKNAQIVGGKINHENSFIAKFIGISDFGGYQDNNEKYVTCIPTCNLAVKKEIFKEFSFDPKLRSAGDRLFSWKLVEAGYKLLYHPSIQITHKPSIKLSRFLERKYRYGKAFVQIRKRVKTLPAAKLVRLHIPGLIIIALTRFLLDTYRLFRFRKQLDVKFYEIIPLITIFFIGRLIFLYGSTYQLFQNKKTIIPQTSIP